LDVYISKTWFPVLEEELSLVAKLARGWGEDLDIFQRAEKEFTMINYVVKAPAVQASRTCLKFWEAEENVKPSWSSVH
jgi:hypothetical protein